MWSQKPIFQKFLSPTTGSMWWTTMSLVLWTSLSTWCLILLAYYAPGGWSKIVRSPVWILNLLRCHLSWYPCCQLLLSSWDIPHLRALECLNNLVLQFYGLPTLSPWSITTSTLMMETEEISESLLLNSSLTWLIVRDISKQYISYICHNRTKRYCNCLSYCFCTMLLQYIYTHTHT
jgi:hypothetical protein